VGAIWEIVRKAREYSMALDSSQTKGKDDRHLSDGTTTQWSEENSLVQSRPTATHA